MGLAPDIARAAIRISLGPSSTERDIAAFLVAWDQIAAGRRERAVA
jgi:cysteine desulfurase